MNVKFNLLTKFIIVYLLIAISGFVLISFVSNSLSFRNVIEESSEKMYREAVTLSRQYSSLNFTPDNLESIRFELNTIAETQDIRITIINTNGDVILDTQPVNGDGYIENFDSALTGNKYYQTGNFFGYFDTQMLSVMAPITSIYTTKGYVALHTSAESIRNQVNVTFFTNYVVYAIMIALMLAFIILYYFVVHKPLSEIINGAKEYGKGNLSYKIKQFNNDELGNLSVALNLMASELNEMDKYQKKFISNVSHDFRSPLTSIKGYLEAIKDGTIPPEMLNKYIDIVLFETERLTKLTSNILTLNDLDPKTVCLDITTFDINNIIRHIIETFEGICKERKISFELTFSSKVLNVNGDIGKIQQVIYNLVDNAIKFSNPGSNIFISTHTKGDKAYISVKDTGTGIPKENLSKIWDRFYKSDSSRGKDKKGSGLGLSITKEIIQAHNETIDVISTEGVGTEFIFTLPFAGNKKSD